MKDLLLRELTQYKESVSTSLPIIELGIFSSSELIESGFIKKKTDLLISYCSLEDVLEYYDTKCKDMLCKDFEGDIESKDEWTIETFINSIKIQVVKNKINQELSDYLKEIKSEK